MSEATNRVLEAQLRRQKQNDKRQKEWETALKPTTIDGSGVLRQLGQQPLDNRQILPNTASLNRPIRPTSVPGGVVADWLPRVKKEVPEVKAKIKGTPPGNWVALFDQSWIETPEAVLLAKALLRFIGADVAGAVQLDIGVGILYTRLAILEAATQLGILVDETTPFLFGTLTTDYPIITNNFSIPVLPQLRDRAARWGVVFLTEGFGEGRLDLFFKPMQVASTEAIAGVGTTTLTQYDDINRPTVTLSLIEVPGSPFSPSVVGASSFTVNRPRYTNNTTLELIPDNIYIERFSLGGILNPFPRSRIKNSVSPQQLCIAAPGIVSGFFSQVNTIFPAPINYKRLK